MIRIYLAVGLLSLRVRSAERRSRNAYIGRHWAPGCA